MYVSGIRLTNIRAFKDLTLEIMESRRLGHSNVLRPRQRTVFIGANGTCKTTLLRCIAIGLSNESWANALVAERNGYYLGQYDSKGAIEIDFMDHDDGSKRFTRSFALTKSGAAERVEIQPESDNVPPDSIPFLYGCGAGRAFATPEAGQEYRIVDAVYTLFQYEAGLNLPELILRRLRDHVGTTRYDTVMRGIKKALGLLGRHTIELLKGGGIEVSGPSVGATIPLEAWADGYRLAFNWIVDVYGWAMQKDCITEEGGIHGVVLVDELEQHLHPTLQTQLLPKLTELWPEAQLFTTTHSPLVILGARPGEVVGLRRRGKQVTADQTLPDFSAYSAEDMLASPKLFESNVYSPETGKMLARYRRLVCISADKRTARQKSALRTLTKQLTAQQVLDSRESDIDRRLDALLKRYDL